MTNVPAKVTTLMLVCGEPSGDQLGAELMGGLKAVAGNSVQIVGVGGAAMIPIFVGSSLRAMLELSRPVRAFRRDDLQRAERIAQRALYQHES